MSLAAILLAVLQREVQITLRSKTEILSPLFFFVLTASLFPLGLGPEPALLRVIAPGVLWVCALLAVLLSLGTLFAPDAAEGLLEQMVLGTLPLSLLALTKALAHWLLTGLPLALLAPLLAMQYGLGGREGALLALSLLLGTPSLSLLGALGAALTLNARGGGVLLSLLILPLAAPVLIFGAGALSADLSGLGAGAHLSLLGALLALLLALAPPATALALRIALE